MILYLNDWNNYPNAVVDITSKNQSFIDYSSLLRKMNIKNHLFPLSLLQPELQGIDPFSDSLDDETKLKITLECYYNFWYYIREVVRVPPVSSLHALPFKANRGNIALYFSFHSNIDFALIQPRQTGKSLSVDILMSWLIFIRCRNTLINLLTKDNTLRVETIDKIKSIRDYLPPYLVPIHKDDVDNQTMITAINLGNRYRTSVTQTSETAANKVARGLTSPIFHIDEIAFIKYVDKMLPAALASGIAAKQEAKTFNQPYGTIITTTAGKRDEKEGAYAYDLIHNGWVFNEHLYDCDDKKEAFQFVKANKRGKRIIINGTFSYKQLGYTDEWAYDLIAELNLTKEAADRDIFNIWTFGTQKHPLNTDILMNIKNSEIEPLYRSISKELYTIDWYINYEQIQRLKHESIWILGLDTSEAIGEDSIAMVMIDSKSLETIAIGTFNETNLFNFSNFLNEFLLEFPNIILVPERRSTGKSVVDLLLIKLSRSEINPFARIYNKIVDKVNERKEDFDLITQPNNYKNPYFFDKYGKEFGLATSAQTRNLLYKDVFLQAALHSQFSIKDKVLSNEIRNLSIKNNRIDHKTNSHDDHVIAWLLAHWFLKFTQNLNFYGIDDDLLLSEVNESNKPLNDYEKYQLEKQKQLKKQMEEVFEELTNTLDDFKITRLEHQLKGLAKDYMETEKTVFSINTLIEEAKKERIKKQQKRKINKYRSYY